MDDQLPEAPKLDNKFAFMNRYLSARMASFIFIALSVALIIGVITSAFMSNQLDLITEPLVNDQKDVYVDDKDAKSWKTYSDYDYNFDIKYPTGWVVLVEDEAFGMLRTVTFSKAENELPAITVSAFDKEDYAKKLITRPLSANNMYALKKGLAFNFNLILPPADALTLELEKIYRQVFSEMISSHVYNPPDELSECIVTGCSGQICSDKEVTTSCEMMDAYLCYKTAKCERQPSGRCGWTQTDDLKQCLNEAVGVKGIDISLE